MGDDALEAEELLIRSLRVERFKSLAEIDIDLGSVNVFIGGNGAGKSNLLEAIGVLGAAAAGRIDDQALLRRGVRPGIPRLYKSSFRKERAHGSISLEASSAGGATYRASITNQGNPPKPWWTFTHETLTHRGSSWASRGPNGTRITHQSAQIVNNNSVASVARASLATPRHVTQFLEVLDDYAIFSPVTPVLRGIAPDSAPRNPVGLYGGQLPEALSLLLSSKSSAKILRRDALAFIDWAADFAVSEPSRSFISPSVPTMRQVVTFRDSYMADKRQTLSGYDASEGALYILFMLALALHPQAPMCLAVDNFDQALNPRIAKELARLFANEVLRGKRQAFLTTHNASVLDGLPLGDLRVKLYAVSRDSKGHTRVQAVEVRDLTRLKAKHGEDAISRLWIQGRLGGMPNVRRL